MKGAAQLFSSARVKAKPARGKKPAKVPSDLWRTPEHILERVRQVGPIELDVATSKDNPVGAGRFYTEEDDGLEQSWQVDRYSVCWSNYPYSQGARWLERAAYAWLGNRIVLGPARTDTAAWHEHVWGRAARVCFVRGRLVFEVPPCKKGHDWRAVAVRVKRRPVQKMLCTHCNVEKPTSAPFPSCLILYSREQLIRDRFELVFGEIGKVVTL